MPPTGWRGKAVRFARSPASAVIFVKRARFAKDWIDDGPGRLDQILTRKKSGFPLHGVTEEPLICFHAARLSLRRRIDNREFDGSSQHTFAGALGLGADRNHDFGR